MPPPSEALSSKSYDADDLEDLYRLRAVLEGHAAGRAAGNISEADLASLPEEL